MIVTGYKRETTINPGDETTDEEIRLTDPSLPQSIWVTYYPWESEGDKWRVCGRGRKKSKHLHQAAIETARQFFALSDEEKVKSINESQEETE